MSWLQDESEEYYDEACSIINRIAIDTELSKLEPRDRELVWMAYEYRIPAGYSGPWPASKAQIGEFIGLKYGNAPISVRGVQRRLKKLLKLWADRRSGQHNGPVRRRKAGGSNDT